MIKFHQLDIACGGLPLHFGQLGIHTLVLILDLVIFNLQIVVLLGHFLHLDVGFDDVASLLSGMKNLIQTFGRIFILK